MDDAREKLEARVTDLEVRLVWQDRTIAELDEVVQRFTARVETLEQELATMRETLSGPEAGPHSDKPPHY